ncbi:hypothetical protein BGW39_003803 [Mortierella sp. 14UC]|nr:hypothetical protein BGW39_003803 [Mortierella sp. 14UC]
MSLTPGGTSSNTAGVDNSTIIQTRHDKSTRISPMAIPELLFKIFSFIDSRQLARKVILVCRQWCIMNHQFVTRNRGIYFNEDETNLLLNKALFALPWSTWAKWYSESPLDNQGIQRRALGKILKDKSDQYHTTLQLQEQEQDLDLQLSSTSTARADTPATAALLPSRNRDLVSQQDTRALTDYARVRWRIVPLLPYLRSLTSLRIHLVDRFDIQLVSLFVALPLLQKLDLRTIGTITVSVTTAADFSINQCTETTKAVATGQSQGQDNSERTLPHFRFLIVKHSRIDQTELERFLTRTVRPQVLKLIALLSVSRTFYPQAPLRYDAPRLLQHFQALPLPLRTLHVSILDEVIPEPLQKESDMLTPGARDLTARELLPSMIQSMDQMQNIITTLNLFGTKVCGVENDVLHRYLCVSPHLLHLGAVDTAYLVNCFDIQKRMWSTGSCLSATARNDDGGTGDAGNRRQPGIWKCRKLRRLHLGFHALDAHNSCALATSQHALILFGYISLVCPLLEDLFIHGRENLENTQMNPSVNLEPGLYLLARLRFLKALKVGRAWRRMLGEADDNIDTNTNMNNRSNNNFPAGTGNDRDAKEAAALKVTLKDLGPIADVKKVIEKMDAVEEGYVCWPDIRRVSIFSETLFGLPVEKEYLRIIKQR